MQKFNIGIIGNGFVGNALYEGMKSFVNAKIFDTNEEKSIHSLNEVLSREFIFLCVPTPKKNDGQIDLSCIEQCFEMITSNRHIVNPHAKIVIKSTVIPGTCKRLSDIYNIKVLSNPEFLTERFAQHDFDNPRCIIIGGDSFSAKRLQELYQTKFSKQKVQYFLTDTTTSELIKYTTNCFFAVKISFMNELKQIADICGADWKDVVKGFVADGRVYPQHLDVPGHDNLLGFGGKCLPKDLSALITFATNNNISPTVMKAALQKNQELRK